MTDDISYAGGAVARREGEVQRIIAFIRAEARSMPIVAGSLVAQSRCSWLLGIAEAIECGAHMLPPSDSTGAKG